MENLFFSLSSQLRCTGAQNWEMRGEGMRLCDGVCQVEETLVHTRQRTGEKRKEAKYM